ncbi:hypothetical protein BGZ47_011009 [Haplosporangium gracile]|nr:hypothetical protein BGZ47_011009 [Haplosporangium gracile]
MKTTRSLPMVSAISFIFISLLALVAMASLQALASPVPLLPGEELIAETYPIYVDSHPNPTRPEAMKMKMKMKMKRGGPIRTPPPGPGTGGTYDKNQPGNRR